MLKSNETLDDATKSELQTQLNNANAALQKAIGYQALVDERKKAIEQFPDELKKKEQQLKSIRALEKPDSESNASQLQMLLQEKRQEYKTLKDRRSLIDTQIEARDDRIADLPGDQTSANEELKSIKRTKSDLKPQEADVATSLILSTKELAAQKEIDALSGESAYHEKLGILLPLDRSLVIQELKILEQEIEAFEAAYNQKREIEIRMQQQEALDAALNAEPALFELAEQNKKWAKRTKCRDEQD